MEKKGYKVSSSKSVESLETPEENSNWVATNLLDSCDSGKSTIKEEKLAEARLLFNGDVVAVIPQSMEFADWCHEGWVCF